jgi:DNA-binding NtrC family response regulator
MATYANNNEKNMLQINMSMDDVKKKCVLIIDDEEILRDILCEVLHMMDFSTLTASCGNEGLEIFKEQKNDIELILLDLLMPGISGLEAYRHLLSIKPDVKIILMSGFPDKDALQIENCSPNCTFLKKPFSIQDINDKVNELLEFQTG